MEIEKTQWNEMMKAIHNVWMNRILNRDKSSEDTLKKNPQSENLRNWETKFQRKDSPIDWIKGKWEYQVVLRQSRRIGSLSQRMY